MLITLDSVHINLVGAIGEDQSVPNMPQNQIVAIIGENKDEGGSNGSSKSTFTFAPPLSLFGAKAVGKTNKDLKNDKIKGTPRVIVKYTLDGKPLIVDRVIGGELKFTYDGKVHTGDAGEVQGQLEKTLGLTKEQFLQFSYKGQKTTEHFLKMDDADKKDFLSSFFDMSKLEKMKEIADLNLSSSEKEKKLLEVQVTHLIESVQTSENNFKEISVKFNEVMKSKTIERDGLESLLKSSEEQIADLKNITEQSVLDSDEEYVLKNKEYLDLQESTSKKNADLQDKIDKNKQLISQKRMPQKDDFADGLKREIDSLVLSKTKIKVPDELNEQLAQCGELVANQRTVLKELTRQQNSIESIKKEISLNESMIAEIDSKPCPTCHRQFDDEHKDQQKVKFKDKIKDLNGMLDSAITIANKMKEEASEDNLNLLIQEQANLTAEINVYKQKKSSEVDSQITELKAKLDVHLNKIKSDIEIEIKTIESDLNALESEKKSMANNLAMLQKDLNIVKDKALAAYKEAVSEADRQNAQLRSSLALIKKEIEGVEGLYKKEEQSLNSLRDQLKQAEDKKSLISEKVAVLEHTCFILSKNGFTGYLFDSILDDLNTEINNNLKLVPVTSKFTLNFTPDKTTKKGEVSKVITYEMTKNGIESSLSKTSGAEELIILLSVDEAVETVLSRRLGINIGWKVLDEQLYWVDNNSKEYVYEFYRHKSKDKTYYLIDHASEFNAAIDCTIKVIKENDVARIEHV